MTTTKKPSKQEVFAKITLDIEFFLSDNTKIDKVHDVLFSGKKTLTNKDYSAIRKIIGIDSLKPGGFYPKERLPISLGLKVDVVRTIKSLGASDVDLSAIFGILSTTLRKIMSSPATNIALAVRQYFDLRKGRIADVRRAIDVNLGIKVKKGVDYPGEEMKKLMNIFVTRLNITSKQSEKIFYSDIFGLDLSEGIMKKLSETKTRKPAPYEPKFTPAVQTLIEKYFPLLYNKDLPSKEYIQLLKKVREEFSWSDIGSLSMLKTFSTKIALKARYEFFRAAYSFEPENEHVNISTRTNLIGNLMNISPATRRSYVSGPLIDILGLFIELQEDKLDEDGKERLKMMIKIQLGFDPNCFFMTGLDKAKLTIFFLESLNVGDDLIRKLYGDGRIFDRMGLLLQSFRGKSTSSK